MSAREDRDKFIEDVVRDIQATAAKSRTVQEADYFLDAVRATMAAHLARLRRGGADPRIVEAFARLLGRVYDATESGGRAR